VVSLEFNKLVEQVEKFGRMAGKFNFDVGDLLQVALERLAAAGDLDAVHQRIELVRGPDVSGYRGAAPLDAPFHEPVNTIGARPTTPDTATVIAGDGSQIYPDEKWRLPYYLTNIGIYTYFHGDNRIPTQATLPKLVFHPDHVRDKSKRVLPSKAIDCLRTVREMEELARCAWELRDDARPLIVLYDNHLLFWVNSDVPGHAELSRRYLSALVRLNDAGALLAGYVSQPTRSRLVIRLLHLLSLSDDEVRTTELGSGDLEGLRDIDIFRHVLQPGERSALMVQNSPRNLAYKQRGESYEVAFFYVKVTSGYQDEIARVDLPVWVARDKAAVDALHGILLHQCAMQGRNPYPYALTRADEIAVVSGQDKRKLEEMIRMAWRQHQPELDPLLFSAKTWGKQLARSSKRTHEL
jgi:hypothetical protein